MGDKPEDKLKWEVQEDGPDPKDDADDDAFFSICGNFNDWEDDRMAAGDVPGVHTATLEVPDSGILEWRFLKDGDKDRRHDRERRQARGQAQVGGPGRWPGSERRRG